MSEPEFLAGLCDFISDGGSLSDKARDLQANYRWLFDWVNDANHPERAETFKAASAARDSLMSEDIVTQLQRMSHFDIRGAFAKNGDLLPISEIPDDVAKVITSIDSTEDATGRITTKLRFADRGAMLALAGRRMQMFTDNVKVTGPGPGGSFFNPASLRGLSPDEAAQLTELLQKAQAA